MSGAASFIDAQGYTFDVNITWAARPAADVGSNPPGKTDIVIRPQHPFSGSITNTTTGGRILPIQTNPKEVTVAGVYPADAPVCAKAFRDQPGMNHRVFRTAVGCVVEFQKVVGLPRAHGAFDASLPNGIPVPFTYVDLADSGGYPEGTVWSGLNESTAPGVVQSLMKPNAIGLLVRAGTRVTSAGACKLTWKPDSGGAYEFMMAPLEGKC